MALFRHHGCEFRTRFVAYDIVDCTLHAISFDRSGKCRLTKASVNPWGMSLDAADVDIQLDLTGKFFERTNKNGDMERVAVTHTTMHEFYIETIRKNAPESGDGDVLSGGGFFYSPTGSGGIELASEQNERGRPIALASVNPDLPAIGFETVFNGDFRFKIGACGKLPGTDEKQYRIPGWRGEQPLKVTPEGRLRLAVPAGEQAVTRTVSLTHNPMFIPPDATTIEFDASSLVDDAATGESIRLATYFVPVDLDDRGNLAPDSDRSNCPPIGSWTLSGDAAEDEQRLPFDSVRTLSLPVPSLPGAVGTVGSFRFEVTATRLGANMTDLVELDNVRLGSIPRSVVTAGLK